MIMTESTRSIKGMTMMIGSLKRRKRSLVTMTQMTIVIGNIRKRRNLINMIKIVMNLILTVILEKVNRNIVKRIKTTIVRIRKSMKKNAIEIKSIETRLVGLNIEKEIRTGIGRRTSMTRGKEIAQSRKKTMISTIKIVKETKKGHRRIKINQNTKISHLILTVSF